jgi:serine/threonine protein kinase
LRFGRSRGKLPECDDTRLTVQCSFLPAGTAAPLPRAPGNPGRRQRTRRPAAVASVPRKNQPALPRAALKFAVNHCKVRIEPLSIEVLFYRCKMAEPGLGMISFQCPACSTRLRVRPELSGKRARCPHCRRTIPVPTTSLADDPASQPGIASDAVHKAATVTPSDVRQPGTDTQSSVVASSRDNRLTGFLGRPQQPGELGRLGAYRVLRVLGHGGMGVVFEAEDLQLRRRVALKAMLPELAADETSRQRFLREAQSAAAVEHDHIVSIYQVGEDRGVPYIAMPFLKGESLEQRLARQPPLAFHDVVRIGKETAAGLAAAHQRGLIHRDIKPANLWLEAETNRVKILDFGLARAATDTAHLTQAGAIVGTPAYMAPEQVGGLPLDARCDLFSLGCVLYELSTGELPFKGRDAISTLMAVATENPKPPSKLNPSLPREFSDLVMHLLAKSPADRPRSAEALFETLIGIDDKRAVSTKSYAGSLPRKRMSGARAAAKNKWRLTAGLAVALLVIVLVGLSASGIIRKHRSDGAIGAAPEPGTVPSTASPAVMLLQPFHRMAIIRVGQWRVEGDELIQEDTTTPFPDIFFGDFEWTDYDFSFLVQRTKGNDLFALHCRGFDRNSFKFQAGSYGNRQSQLLYFDKGVWTEVQRSPFSLRNGACRVTFRVRGNRYQAILNDRVIADYVDPAHISRQGRVGLGSTASAYRFSKIEVRSATGKLLWTGPPELDAPKSAGADLSAAAGLENIAPTVAIPTLLAGAALVGVNVRENGVTAPYRIDITERSDDRFQGTGTGDSSGGSATFALAGNVRGSEVTFELGNVLKIQTISPAPAANNVAFVGKLEHGILEGQYAAHDGKLKGALHLNLAAVYTGTYAFATGAAAKGSVRIEITERQDNHFKGTLTTDDGPTTWIITGTVANGEVQWQWGNMVSKDGCSAERLTNNCRFAGTCKDGIVQGTWSTLDNAQTGSLRATRVGVHIPDHE